jgi:hypothetical protein
MSNYAREQDGVLFVCVEKLERLKAYLDRIDNHDPKLIVYHQKGVPMNISKAAKQEWSEAGFKNSDLPEYLEQKFATEHQDNDV